MGCNVRKTKETTNNLACYLTETGSRSEEQHSQEARQSLQDDTPEARNALIGK
jgi:ribosomal protein S17E